MKSERIKVRETHPVVSLLLSLTLIPLVGAASAIAAINILTRLQPVDPSMIMLIFVGVGVAPSAIVAWLISLGRRATATPILHIDGTVSAVDSGAADSEVPQRPPNEESETRSSVGALRRAAGAVFTSSVKEPVCVKFIVCEEGIVLYRSGRAGLVRWDRIRDIKADHKSRRFEFTAKKMLGRDSFSAPDRFDEVKHMLSEHISVH